MPQAPYSLAMVICDAIHRDPATRKATILGCFTTLFVSEFPVTHPRISIYAALTDGHGEMTISIRVTDVDGEQVLYENSSPQEFKDPREIHEIDFFTGSIRFPQPGEYRFQLLAGQEVLIERRLLVAELKEQKQ